MVKNFVEELIANQLITAESLAKVQPGESSSFVYTLVQQDLVDEEKFVSFYAAFAQVRLVSLATIKAQVLNNIDGHLLRKYHACPLVKAQGVLTMAMVDPLDYEAIECFEMETQCRINPVLVRYSEMQVHLDEKFGVVTSVQNIVHDLERADVSSVMLGSLEHEVFQASSSSGPVNKLLHLVMSHALKEKASDIHFEPTERDMQCRFRVDGVLSRFLTFPKPLAASLVSSIKVLAKMDIAEKRVPLDGGFQVKIEHKVIDLRVSSFPLIEGEKIVIRILDRTGMRFSLGGLGMTETMLEQFVPVISKNTGIVLVTGPTGSGKTTTLYAVLEKIKSVEKNIVTIEDPVEYHLDGINQSQVNTKAGLTFAKGLRSFLRQDPDILLVGEVRDRETAEISFQAALTGHLVLSTLHTNDAASSITRLRDMGLEAYLLSSSIIGVVAQRLARRTCPYCQETYIPDEQALLWLGIKSRDGFIRGKGCESCKQTGYRGRVGLFELLIPDEEINNLIHAEQSSSEQLMRLAKNKGMITLRDDAREKVLAGLTTAEEVYRVLR